MQAILRKIYFMFIGKILTNLKVNFVFYDLIFVIFLYKMYNRLLKYYKIY